MTWTHFWDMHSGGSLKEKWSHIYIEAPEAEAKRIFYNRFDHNPDRVTCTCCGPDYSISSEESLLRLTGYHRNCDALETPRDPETGRYVQVDDPWFNDHYYLEPDEVEEAVKRGYEIKPNLGRELAARFPESSHRHLYKTLEDYVADDDVLVLHASDIKPEERTGDVPEQGYVWAG